MVDDTLSLVVGGYAFAGWQSIRVTRGVERCPSDFDLMVTERFPGSATQIDIQPGQSCVVKIGGDTVTTGYIDRYHASLGPRGHTVRIQGRSLCGDIVDSHAYIAGMQLSAVSALSLAEALTLPFGISVTSLSGPGPAIPQFNVVLTETPYEIIERVARYAQLLVYDDPNGNLVLSQVGSRSMASGFQQGVNIQEASVAFSVDERFSDYIAVVMPNDKWFDLGKDGNTIGHVNDESMAALKRLDGQPRVRRQIIVSEQVTSDGSLALQRANWEKARRLGRSQAVRLTCDSWRDRAGTLWQPNALATLSLPALKLDGLAWVIADVSYLRDLEGGTRAELTLMPPDAFQPQPSALQLYDWQIGADLANANHGLGVQGSQQ